MSAMKLCRLLSLFLTIHQSVSAMSCFFCLNCTLPSDSKMLFKCAYKFTHCAAVHLSIDSACYQFILICRDIIWYCVMVTNAHGNKHLSIAEQNASLFACGVAKTCTEHFTDDSVMKIFDCYICEQDYCNAYIEAPFVWSDDP